MFVRLLCRCALVVVTIGALSASSSGISVQSGGSNKVRVGEAIRRQGQALVQLADARARGEPVPSDFTLDWSNDFFKARPGTFVPFTLTFPSKALAEGPALLYVRVESAVPGRGRRSRAEPLYPYETIFPVTLTAAGDEVVRLRRGFAVEPGSYRVTVVLQGASNGVGRMRGAPRTSVLERILEVPDFWTGTLATSTVILADRLEPLGAHVASAELDEDPYVVGSHRIHPAASAVYNRQQELIVVLLIYNPVVAPDKQFDLQVDYHLFKQNPQGGAGDPGARPGEVYMTRTNPQRFNPSLMGTRFDPVNGTPILAGQAIPLVDFEAGAYRLNVVVTDMLSRRVLSRDVMFAVVGS